MKNLIDQGTTRYTVCQLNEKFSFYFFSVKNLLRKLIIIIIISKTTIPPPQKKLYNIPSSFRNENILTKEYLNPFFFLVTYIIRMYLDNSGFKKKT